MIMRHLKRRRQVVRQKLILINDTRSRSNAMQYFWNVVKRASIYFSNSLVPQANTQNTFRGSVLLDDILHDTRLVGNSRPGGKKYFVKPVNFLQGDLVIPV